METKYFVQSKRFWGALFGFASIILTLIVEIEGLSTISIWPTFLPEPQWVKVAFPAISLCSTMWGFYGGVVAKAPLSFKR